MRALHFQTFADAFAVCRDRDAPLVVVIMEPCNDCCAETANVAATGNTAKRAHKIYPSGRAVPLMHAAEDYVGRAVIRQNGKRTFSRRRRRRHS